jgi:ATP-binding protein involved in chromosome partitioning
MKIAVPVENGRLCMHFGHCEKFEFYVSDKAKNIIATTGAVPPAYEPGVLPRWLHENGVNVIIAGGMGMRAQQFFQQYGVRVVVGAPSLPAREAVESWLHGTLKTGGNVCDH